MEALWNCFESFRPSSARSINLVKDLHDAVVTVKDPSWGPKAMELLKLPIADPSDSALVMDQLEFHQLTSAQLLRELAPAGAATVLVTALLTPQKRDLYPVLRGALVVRSRESEIALLAAMNGTDRTLGALYLAYPEGQGLSRIAESLVYVAGPDARGLLLQRLAAARDDATRTVVASALVHLPKSDARRAAMLAAYRKVSPSVTVLVTEHLAPQGDAAAADKLDRIIASDKASGDMQLRMTDDVLGRTADMLHARTTTQ